MKKTFYILLISFWAHQSVVAQLQTYTFEESEKLAKENPKPFVVFIHTSWCNYCRMMENSTFKNEEVITLLNNKFYFVDFNAEEKTKIEFNNTFFVFKPHGSSSGVHELALQLGTTNGQISYPTLCILNAKKEIIFQYNSFMNAKDLIRILRRTDANALK